MMFIFKKKHDLIVKNLRLEIDGLELIVLHYYEELRNLRKTINSLKYQVQRNSGGREDALSRELEMERAERIRLEIKLKRLQVSKSIHSTNQFSADEINTLIRFCHPDKNGGKESATKITQKLLEMR